jgi:outer membrane protein assembly factor BamB
MARHVLVVASVALVFSLLAFPPAPPTAGAAEPGEAAAAVESLARSIGVRRGLCLVVGPADSAGRIAVALASAGELTVYVQTSGAASAASASQLADEKGLLGSRVFVGQGDLRRLNLADELADAVIVAGNADVPETELLRVLRPEGRAIQGERVVVKPRRAGTDEWTHPYHNPGNNPQSRDQEARRPFLTHFMAEPWYCPLPQMTVIAGGRIYKVFGNRSSARPQEPLIETLLAMSAHNGTVLWQRPLSPGFMIHRNTFIASGDTLYLADDVSCKLIDGATGETRDEIVAPADLADGPVWKWTALEKDVLYALVGEKETSDQPLRNDRLRGAGWPWWSINSYSFGFGRTILAIDPKTKKVLWHRREQERIDSRAMAIVDGRLYYYSDGKFLACIDTADGKDVWRTSDSAVLEAIGAPGRAQHWLLGFASTAYMKCGGGALFFAGPQRERLVAVSAKDGSLLWQRDGGNVQLVYRDDGLYALGEGRTNSAASSLKLEPLTGKVLATFPSRDRCTRATGCADSIFTRGGNGGSTAVFDVTSAEPKMGVVSPMRPACQDGVVVAHGHLFWGPWMCRCDLTQLGVISLGPGRGFDYTAKADEAERLQVAAPAGAPAAALAVTADDWPTFRKDNARSTYTPLKVPPAVEKKWEYLPPGRNQPTAPVAAGEFVFVGGSDGAVRALAAADGTVRWTAYTGGQAKYPPSIAGGRAYVGAGDGHVWCLDAASGKLAWRFRAAPAERVIPVYGSLVSTWPVGSGVLVEDGVAYAAAGIWNYDGTHVYALDAESGRIRWQNNNSGNADAEAAQDGASVQGHLLLHRGAIYMAAGNMPTIASYATADGTFARHGGGRGKDLFVRGGSVSAAGFPLYWRPDDDHFLSLMTLETPAGKFAVTTDKIALETAQAGPDGKPLARWIAPAFQEIAAVAVAPNAVLVTGLDRPDARNPGQTKPGLCAVSMTDGTVAWREPLPADPVAWGLAVDRAGRVIVTLRDGRVLCYAAK